MKDTSPAYLGRRSFLKHASFFAVALPALEFGTLALAGCKQARSLAETGPEQLPNVPWKTTIVAEGEPGEPLIVSGTIYAPDGRTPLEGINLFVYQTDATGVYSTSGGDNRSTRIHGLVRSNKQGRYEFQTIKPGSYPDSRNAAHIHAYVSGSGYPEYWIDEYLFEGDPFITSADRQKFGGKGPFSSILTLQQGSDGVLRAVRDIKVERCTNNCTRR
ncbi:MAG: intradiol ring-cleavage dioxygenase [Pyrinomonadaceae bacterium]|nr:intradiol ring-cleavage dioxygenase [Pyrinomonadaceae bacterium]